MLTDTRCRSPPGINYTIIIVSYFNVSTFLAIVWFCERFYNNKMHGHCSSTISIWMKLWVLNIEYTILTNLAARCSSEAEVDCALLYYLRDYQDPTNNSFWAEIAWIQKWSPGHPKEKNKTHTTVHICPVQLLERPVHAYPKGSRGWEESVNAWLAKFLMNRTV